MGSATTHALAAAHAALGEIAGIDLGVAGDLFEAARAIGGSSHLRSALADASAPAEARRRVVTEVFGPAVSAPVVTLLSAVVDQRWSSASDLVDGVEELAVRAASVAMTPGSPSTCAMPSAASMTEPTSAAAAPEGS